MVCIAAVVTAFLSSCIGQPVGTAAADGKIAVKFIDPDTGNDVENNHVYKEGDKVRIAFFTEGDISEDEARLQFRIYPNDPSDANFGPDGVDLLDFSLKSAEDSYNLLVPVNSNRYRSKDDEPWLNEVFDFFIRKDSTAELKEAFSVSLISRTPGVEVADPLTFYVEASNDPLGLFSVEADKTSVIEGQPMSFKIKRAGGGLAETTVNWYITSEQQNPAADLVGDLTGTAVFGKDDFDDQTITINTKADSTPEVAETFTFLITTCSDNCGAQLEAGKSRDTCEIASNGNPNGVITVVPPGTVNEGDEVAIVFERTGSELQSQEDVTVSFQFTEGTAQDSYDKSKGDFMYGKGEKLGDTVTIAKGEYSAVVKVKIHDDALQERTESFDISITKAVSATNDNVELGNPKKATISIAANDKSCGTLEQFGFGNTREETETVPEGQTVELSIYRKDFNKDDPQDLTVEWEAIGDESALDRIATRKGVLQFREQFAVSDAVKIKVTENNLAEIAETITFKVTGVTGCEDGDDQLGRNEQDATLTLLPSDSPNGILTLSGASMCKEGVDCKMQATWSGYVAGTQGVEVVYHVLDADGNAASDDFDDDGHTSTLTFEQPDGTSTADITREIVLKASKDGKDEAEESFSLVLKSAKVKVAGSFTAVGDLQYSAQSAEGLTDTDLDEGKLNFKVEQSGTPNGEFSFEKKEFAIFEGDPAPEIFIKRSNQAVEPNLKDQDITIDLELVTYGGAELGADFKFNGDVFFLEKDGEKNTFQATTAVKFVPGKTQIDLAKVLKLEIVDDGIAELEESFTITLKKLRPTGNQGIGIDTDNADVTITIPASDAAVGTFTMERLPAEESAPEGTSVTLKFSRDFKGVPATLAWKYKVASDGNVDYAEDDVVRNKNDLEVEGKILEEGATSKVVFGLGKDTVEVTVLVRKDAIPENEEEIEFSIFDVTAENVKGLDNPTFDTATVVTITVPQNDNPNGVVSIEAADGSAEGTISEGTCTISSDCTPEKKLLKESDRAISLTVRRTQGLDGKITATIAMVGGENDFDFAATTQSSSGSGWLGGGSGQTDTHAQTQSVTFEGDDQEKKVTFIIRDDCVPEEEESFSVSVRAITEGNAAISTTRNEAKIVIPSNDYFNGVVELLTTAFEAEEDGDGAQFVVRAVRKPYKGETDGFSTPGESKFYGSVTASYTISDGENVFEKSTGTLTFEDGEAETTDIITVKPNDVPEFERTFTLTLDDKFDTEGAVRGCNTAAAITLKESDSPIGDFSLETPDCPCSKVAGVCPLFGHFAEGTNVEGKVLRAKGTDGKVVVTLQFKGRAEPAQGVVAATAGDFKKDIFYERDGEYFFDVTFGPGEEEKPFSWPITDDNVPEQDKDFVISIVGATQDVDGITAAAVPTFTKDVVQRFRIPLNDNPYGLFTLSLLTGQTDLKVVDEAYQLEEGTSYTVRVRRTVASVGDVKLSVGLDRRDLSTCGSGTCGSTGVCDCTDAKFGQRCEIQGETTTSTITTTTITTTTTTRQQCAGEEPDEGFCNSLQVDDCTEGQFGATVRSKCKKLCNRCPETTTTITGTTTTVTKAPPTTQAVTTQAAVTTEASNLCNGKEDPVYCSTMNLALCGAEEIAAECPIRCDACECEDKDDDFCKEFVATYEPAQVGGLCLFPSLPYAAACQKTCGLCGARRNRRESGGCNDPSAVQAIGLATLADIVQPEGFAVSGDDSFYHTFEFKAGELDAVANFKLEVKADFVAELSERFYIRMYEPSVNALKPTLNCPSAAEFAGAGVLADDLASDIRPVLLLLNDDPYGSLTLKMDEPAKGFCPGVGGLPEKAVAPAPANDQDISPRLVCEGDTIHFTITRNYEDSKELEKAAEVYYKIVKKGNSEVADNDFTEGLTPGKIALAANKETTQFSIRIKDDETLEKHEWFAVEIYDAKITGEAATFDPEEGKIRIQSGFEVENFAIAPDNDISGRISLSSLKDPAMVVVGKSRTLAVHIERAGGDFYGVAATVKVWYAADADQPCAADTTVVAESSKITMAADQKTGYANIPLADGALIVKGGRFCFTITSVAVEDASLTETGVLLDFIAPKLGSSLETALIIDEKHANGKLNVAYTNGVTAVDEEETLDFVVSRTGGVFGDVRLAISVSAKEVGAEYAIPADDFDLSVLANVILKDGDTKVEIAIPAVADNTPELKEDFTVTITAVEGAGAKFVIGTKLFEEDVAISENENPFGTAVFVPASPEDDVIGVGYKPDGKMTLSLTREGGSFGSLTVTVAVQDKYPGECEGVESEWACCNVDVKCTTTSVTFAEGVTQQTVEVVYQTEEETPTKDQNTKKFLAIITPKSGEAQAANHGLIATCGGTKPCEIRLPEGTKEVAEPATTSVVASIPVERSDLYGELSFTWQLFGVRGADGELNDPTKEFVQSKGSLKCTHMKECPQIELEVKGDDDAEVDHKYTLAITKAESPKTGEVGIAVDEYLITVAANDYWHGLIGFDEDDLAVSLHEHEAGGKMNITLKRDFGLYDEVSVHVIAHANANGAFNLNPTFDGKGCGASGDFGAVTPKSYGTSTAEACAQKCIDAGKKCVAFSFLEGNYCWLNTAEQFAATGPAACPKKISKGFQVYNMVYDPRARSQPALPFDYKSVDQVVTFKANQQEAQFEVEVKADADAEEDETFILEITEIKLAGEDFTSAKASESNLLGPSVNSDRGLATVTIPANDDAGGVVGIIANSCTAKVDEGGVIKFKVSREGRLVRSTVVSYVVVGVGPNGVEREDFISTTAMAGTVTFGSELVGTTQEVEASIDVKDDASPEGGEKYAVRLVSGTHGVTLNSQAIECEGIINSNDGAAGYIRLDNTAKIYEIGENSLPVGRTVEKISEEHINEDTTVEFAVSRVASVTESDANYGTEVTFGEVEVSFYVSTDYDKANVEPKRGVVKIADGESVGYFNVTFADNKLPSKQYELSVYILHGAEENIDTTGKVDPEHFEQTITVKANDFPLGIFNFCDFGTEEGVTAVSATEKEGVVEISICRSQGTDGEVTVMYEVETFGDCASDTSCKATDTSGQADGNDFTEGSKILSKPEPVIFRNGEKIKNITIDINDDDDAEPSELFKINLVNIKNADGDVDSVSATIGDAGSVSVTLEGSDGGGEYGFIGWGTSSIIVREEKPEATLYRYGGSTGEVTVAFYYEPLDVFTPYTGAFGGIEIPRLFKPIPEGKTVARTDANPGVPGRAQTAADCAALAFGNEKHVPAYDLFEFQEVEEGECSTNCGYGCHLFKDFSVSQLTDIKRDLVGRVVAYQFDAEAMKNRAHGMLDLFVGDGLPENSTVDFNRGEEYEKDIVIPDGESTFTFQFPVIDDDVAEAAEAFKIVITSVSVAGVSAPNGPEICPSPDRNLYPYREGGAKELCQGSGTSTAYVVIDASDGAEGTFTIESLQDDKPATEGSTYVLRVKRGTEYTANGDAPPTVSWRIIDESTGNAISDSEFEVTSGELFFYQGDSQQDITLEVKKDGVSEIDETFTVELYDATSAAQINDGADSVTFTVPKNEYPCGHISLEVKDAATLLMTIEGETLTYSVARSETLMNATVQWALSVAGGDISTSPYNTSFEAIHGEVEFQVGDETAEFEIVIKNDIVQEPSHDYTVTISVKDSFAEDCFVTGEKSGNFKVNASDDYVTFAESSLGKTFEMEEGGESVAVDVMRHAITAGDVDVPWSLVCTDCSSDDDIRIEPKEGTLKFVGDDNTKTLTFTFSEDAKAEPDRSIEVVFGKPTNADVVASSQHVMLKAIGNDYAYGLFEFRAKQGLKTEEGKTETMAVERRNGDHGSVDVYFRIDVNPEVGALSSNELGELDDITVSNDHAKKGDLYVLSFGNGDKVGKIELKFNADGISELKEKFVVTLVDAVVTCPRESCDDDDSSGSGSGSERDDVVFAKASTDLTGQYIGINRNGGESVKDRVDSRGITIDQNEDPYGSVSFETTAFDASEGSEYTLEVKRAGGLLGEINVTLVLNGSAVFGPAVPPLDKDTECGAHKAASFAEGGATRIDEFVAAPRNGADTAMLGYMANSAKLWSLSAAGSGCDLQFQSTEIELPSQSVRGQIISNVVAFIVGQDNFAAVSMSAKDMFVLKYDVGTSTYVVFQQISGRDIVSLDTFENAGAINLVVATANAVTVHAPLQRFNEPERCTKDYVNGKDYKNDCTKSRVPGKFSEDKDDDNVQAVNLPEGTAVSSAKTFVIYGHTYLAVSADSGVLVFKLEVRKNEATWVHLEDALKLPEEGESAGEVSVLWTEASGAKGDYFVGVNSHIFQWRFGAFEEMSVPQKAASRRWDVLSVSDDGIDTPRELYVSIPPCGHDESDPHFYRYSSEDAAFIEEKIDSGLPEVVNPRNNGCTSVVQVGDDRELIVRPSYSNSRFEALVHSPFDQARVYVDTETVYFAVGDGETKKVTVTAVLDNNAEEAADIIVELASADCSSPFTDGDCLSENDHLATFSFPDDGNFVDLLGFADTAMSAPTVACEDGEVGCSKSTVTLTVARWRYPALTYEEDSEEDDDESGTGGGSDDSGGAGGGGAGGGGGSTNDDNGGGADGGGGGGTNDDEGGGGFNDDTDGGDGGGGGGGFNDDTGGGGGGFDDDTGGGGSYSNDDGNTGGGGGSSNDDDNENNENGDGGKAVERDTTVSWKIIDIETGIEVEEGVFNSSNGNLTFSGNEAYSTADIKITTLADTDPEYLHRYKIELETFDEDGTKSRLLSGRLYAELVVKASDEANGGVAFETTTAFETKEPGIGNLTKYELTVEAKEDASDMMITVVYTIQAASGEADAADFGGVANGTVDVEPGKKATFSIAVLGDGLSEPLESYSVVLDSATRADGTNVPLVKGGSAIKFTIQQDNDYYGLLPNPPKCSVSLDRNGNRLVKVTYERTGEAAVGAQVDLDIQYDGTSVKDLDDDSFDKRVLTGYFSPGGKDTSVYYTVPSKVALAQGAIFSAKVIDFKPTRDAECGSQSPCLPLDTGKPETWSNAQYVSCAAADETVSTGIIVVEQPAGVDEPARSGATTEITVKRVNGTFGSEELIWKFADPGQQAFDRPINGAVHFAQGQVYPTRPLNIRVRPDSVPEFDETKVMELTTSNDKLLIQVVPADEIESVEDPTEVATMDIVIKANDAPFGTFVLAKDTVFVSDGENRGVKVSVARIGGTKGNVTIPFSVSPNPRSIVQTGLTAFADNTGKVIINQGTSGSFTMLDINEQFKELARGTKFTITLGQPMLSDESASDYAGVNKYNNSPPAIGTDCTSTSCSESTVTVESDRDTFGILTCGAGSDCSVSLMEDEGEDAACPEGVPIDSACKKHTIALVRQPELKEKVDFRYRVYPTSISGDAEANVDFAQQEWKNVVIAQYKASAELAFYIIDDSESEHTEHFVIEVETDSGLELASSVRTIAVTIQANDQPGGLFQFETSEATSVDEPEFGRIETVEVPVVRTQGTETEITILWKGEGDTQSFSKSSGELVFVPGSSRPLSTLTFQIEPDNEPELEQSMTITLCVKAEGAASVCADDSATTLAAIGEIGTKSIIIPANDNPVGTFSVTPSPYVMVGSQHRSFMVTIEREGGSLTDVDTTLKVLGAQESNKGKELEHCEVEAETETETAVVTITDVQWASGCQATIAFAEGEDSKEVRVSVTDSVRLVASESLGVAIEPATVGDLTDINAWTVGRNGEMIWSATNDNAVDPSKKTAFVWVPESAADGHLEFTEASRVVELSEPNAGEAVTSVELVVERVGGTYVPGGTGTLQVECVVIRTGPTAVYGLQPAIQYLEFKSGESFATATLKLQADNIAEVEVQTFVQISNPPAYCGKDQVACTDAPVAVGEHSKATVTIPASDDPFGVIEFSESSVANFLQTPGTVRLYVERSSGAQGPYNAAVVPYRLLAGSSLVESGEIVFGDPADPNVEPREDGLQVYTLVLEVNGEKSNEYTVELLPLEGQGDEFTLGTNSLASITIPTVSASAIDASGCVEVVEVAQLCHGITADKIGRGLQVSSARIYECINALAIGDVDLTQAACPITMESVEDAIRGVIAWAALNGGYALIGGINGVMNVLDRIRDQPNGNGNDQAEALRSFALSLLAGNCVPSTADGCECCCTASAESEDGMLVTASRVLATQLSRPLTPALIFYPEVRLPANTEYLAGFDRLSKSVCEEVYLVSQGATTAGAFKAPEGQSVFSGVLNAGLAKQGYATTLAAAKKRGNSANPPGSFQFDIDVGSENNNRECVAWSVDNSAWSSEGCAETQQVETVVTCECEELAESYALLVTDNSSFPTFVTAGAAIVVVSSAILFFCGFVIAALSTSVVGAVMRHVAIASLLLHLVFIINIMLTKSVDATGQFVVGLLLHYCILAYAFALTAALYFLYSRFRTPVTSATKTSMSKFVLRAVWIVPLAVVLCSILFGLEAYDKSIDAVYADVSGNDKISLIPSAGLFYAGFLVEFILAGIASLVLAGATFVGERSSGSYDAEAQMKGASKDAAGLTTTEIRTTAALLLWCWVGPVLALVAVNTGITGLEYVVAIAMVVQGIGLLVYCFVMADPGDEPDVPESTSEAAESKGVDGPDSSQQPMVLNTMTSFNSMHGPTRSAAWTAFDAQESMGAASLYGGGAPVENAGFSPALVDTAEFDDLIFSLKANPVSDYSAMGGVATTPPGVVELRPLGGMPAGGSSMNNRLSIADTHL